MEEIATFASTTMEEMGSTIHRSDDQFYAFTPVDPDLDGEAPTKFDRFTFLKDDYINDRICTFPFVKVELLNVNAAKYTSYIDSVAIDPAGSNILPALGFGDKKDISVDLAPIFAEGATKVQVGAMLPSKREVFRPWQFSGDKPGQYSRFGNAEPVAAASTNMTFTGSSQATQVTGTSESEFVIGENPNPNDVRATMTVPGTVFNYPPVCGGIGQKRFTAKPNSVGGMDMQDVRYCGGDTGGTVFPDPMAPDVMRGRPYAPVMPTCYWRGYVKPTGDLVEERASYEDEISGSTVTVRDIVAPNAPSVGEKRQQIYIGMESANGTSLSSISAPAKLIVQTGIIGTARLKTGDRFYYEIEDVRHPTMYKTVNIDNITLSLLDENLDYIDLNGEEWSIALAFTFIPINQAPIANIPQYAQALLGHQPTPMSQRIQQAYANLMQAQQNWQENVAELTKKAKKKGKGRRRRINALQQQISNPPRTKPVLAALEQSAPSSQPR